MRFLARLLHLHPGVVTLALARLCEAVVNGLVMMALTRTVDVVPASIEAGRCWLRSSSMVKSRPGKSFMPWPGMMLS